MDQRGAVFNYILMPILLLTVLLTGNLALGAEDEPVVIFSTTTIRPGDFLQVQVKTDPSSKGTARFLGRSKPLYPAPDRQSLIGLIAAPYRTQPGKYLLEIAVKNTQGTLVKEQRITVVPRKFGEQRIRVSEKMRRKTATEDKYAADARVGAVVREQAEAKRLAPLWEESFVWPLKGRKTSEFGLIRYVNNHETGRHSGWDLAAPTGTPVAAVNRGEVVFAGTLYATGYTVIIHHGLDFFSSYAHLSKIDVAEGELVKKGQIIGKVGSTGLATGPHLHLTFRVSDVPVDPALVLGKQIEWSIK